MRLTLYSTGPLSVVEVSTAVFVPPITFTAFLAIFLITVFPLLVIFDRSDLAMPVILAVPSIVLPLPST